MTMKKKRAAVLPQRWDGKDVVCDHDPRKWDPRDCRACGATQCATGVQDISLSLDGSTLLIQVAKGVTVTAERGRQVYAEHGYQSFLPRKVAKRLGWALIIASRFASGEPYVWFLRNWMEAQV